MSLVLDASVTVSWFLLDETGSNVQQLLDRVRREGAIVPALWKLETGNALLHAEQRRRMTKEQRERAIGYLLKLPIKIDAETAARAWHETLNLAERFGLTLYDACYLELAHRRDLPLATFDRELRVAGHALGIELLDLDA